MQARRSVMRVFGGVQVALATTIGIEGGAKPACVVESIVRYIA